MLRGSISSLPGRLRRTRDPRGGNRRASLWALRGVSFELGQGQALGVIGHNGAGKSTLLKILSRVTAPTEGRAILRGRAAALLEVGTGFHPELSGRENVFLNGSVLGMRQSEIRSRFDEIVAFAELASFIETPIKRYSSGMQVRLAFAVAAFLEPEILIVDEVLAVGDAAFQRRCLGKLSASSHEGRTVLFVSHNLTAVRGICPRSILLDHGKIVFDGPTHDAIDRYLSSTAHGSDVWDLMNAERPALEMGRRIRLTRAQLIGTREAAIVGVGDSLTVRTEFDVLTSVDDFVLALNVSTTDQLLVAQSVTTHNYPPLPRLEPGPYVIEASFDAAWLQPGLYSIGLGARGGAGLEDHVNSAGLVEFIEPDAPESPWFGGPGGFLRLPVRWSLPMPADTAPA